MPDKFPPIEVSRKSSAQSGAAMDRRVAPGRWARVKRWRWPLVFGLAALGLLLVWRNLPSAGTLVVNAADLTTGKVARAPFRDYLPARAVVAPLHSVFIDAVTGGAVASVAVQDGTLVAAGQVLATLSNPQLQLDVSARAATITGQLGAASAQQLALQQSLANERASIEATGYDLLKARRDLSVRQELKTQGFESDASVKNADDDARYYETRLGLLKVAYAHDVALAASQRRQITETVSLLRDNLKTVQDSLQALTVRAPVAGRLTNFTIEPGQAVHAGDELGRVDSTHAFRLDADIDEFYLDRIRVGQTATGDFDGEPARLRVALIRPQVNNGQFRVELDFVGAAPAGLQRGEGADIRLTLGATRTALIVPNGPWLTSSGGEYAYVLNAAGTRATRRAISVGRRNPDQVEVLSGLNPGEVVITSAYDGFRNFTTLRVR